MRSKAVVALGEKLVTELGLSDSVDTLGRWMAHYIAELIHESEAATKEDRVAKQAQLRDSVLALWAHRFELPSGKRPFGDFELILRTIESLDPERKTARYFPAERTPEPESNEGNETQQWIELARSLDYVSKILINHCIISAAESSLDQSQEWVTLACEADVGDSVELHAIRFLRDQWNLMYETDPNEHQRRILSGRLNKLKEFVSRASKLADDLEAKLASCDTEPNKK